MYRSKIKISIRMITIDGSKFEGGGQTVRLALSLSAILGRDVKIEKIRAGRPKPGLSNQHLAGCWLAAKMANATMIDASSGGEVQLGTQAMEFCPSKL